MEQITLSEIENPFFQRLSLEEKKILLGFSQKIETGVNQILAEENKPAESFFLIIQGEIALTKVSQNNQVHVLATRHNGEIVGETALFEDEPRGYTLSTTQPSQLLVFDINEIKKNELLYNKLTISAGKLLSIQLRELKTLAAEMVHHRLMEIRKRLLLGTFLVGAIYITDLYILSLVFIEHLNKFFPTTTVLSVIILIIMVTVIVALIKKFKFPLEMFGITLKNCKKNLIESTGFSLLFIAGYSLIKWIAINSFLANLSLKLFDPTAMLWEPAVFTLRVYFTALVFYILFVPFQEFVARGTLQGMFYRFLSGSERVRKWQSILISNLLFAIVHLHASPYTPFLALVPGFFWGWLYYRQQSLVSVIWSHILIGVWVIFIMGFIPGFL